MCLRFLARLLYGHTEIEFRGINVEDTRMKMKRLTVVVFATNVSFFNRNDITCVIFMFTETKRAFAIIHFIIRYI